MNKSEEFLCLQKSVCMFIQDKGNTWLENAWGLSACKKVVKSQVLGGIPGSKANVCT